MTTAITAVRNGVRPSDITIYEASEKCGRKILATGNGRCNLGNEILDSEMFYSSSGGRKEFLDDLIKRINMDDIKDFFRSLGVITVSKNGYLYPRSMQALTVLNALKNECDDLGINIRTKCVCTEVTRSGSGFELLINGKKEYSDVVVLSCGLGSGGFGIKGSEFTALLKGLKIKHNKTVPALCGLDVYDDLRSIKGVRSAGSVSLFVSGRFSGTEEGEIQFTEKAVSGIPVFQLSSLAGRALEKGEKCCLTIDLMNEYDKDDVKEIIGSRIDRFPEREIYYAFNGIMNNKLMSYVLKRSGISDKSPAGSLDDGRKKALFENLKELKFDVKNIQPADKAQTMSGGIDLSAIGRNMDIYGNDGLYVTGEMIDVDGKCGGYNLYLAWATGIICGRSLAK